MVVDTDNYDVLLGLDFLIKIGAFVDVERGLIQMRHGPRANVEVLPINYGNYVAKNELKDFDVRCCCCFHFSGDSDVTIRNPSLYDPIMSKQVDAPMSNSNNDTDDNEHCDEGPQLVEPNGDEYEFGNIELEDLVLLEGQQILQLIL